MKVFSTMKAGRLLASMDLVRLNATWIIPGVSNYLVGNLL